MKNKKTIRSMMEVPKTISMVIQPVIKRVFVCPHCARAIENDAVIMQYPNGAARAKCVGCDRFVFAKTQTVW